MKRSFSSEATTRKLGSDPEGLGGSKDSCLQGSIILIGADDDLVAAGFLGLIERFVGKLHRPLRRPVESRLHYSDAYADRHIFSCPARAVLDLAIDNGLSQLFRDLA